MDANLDTTLIEARQTSTMTPYTDSNTYYTSTRPPTTTLMTPLELTTTLSDDDVLALFRERFVVVNESQLGIKKHEELVQDLVENITSNDPTGKKLYGKFLRSHWEVQSFHLEYFKNWKNS